MATLAQLFETGEQSSQKGHFRNLVLLARLDGSLSETEDKFLQKIARQIGLTQEQVEEIKKNPMDFPTIPPQDIEERYNRLINILQLVLEDNIIDEKEEGAVVNLSLALGFTKEEIQSLVPAIAGQIKNGKTKDQILGHYLRE